MVSASPNETDKFQPVCFRVYVVLTISGPKHIRSTESDVLLRFPSGNPILHIISLGASGIAHLANKALLWHPRISRGDRIVLVADTSRAADPRQDNIINGGGSGVKSRVT